MSMTDRVATTLTYDSPLGPVTLAERDGALVGLWFCGQKYDRHGLGEAVPGHDPVLDEAASWLDAYFAGSAPSEVLAIEPSGTAFQKAVWQALRRIPYGETATYGQVASEVCRMLGRRTSARAVGGAVARNPISIFIPCHRVVGASGSLTGYAGGIERKVALLSLEGVDLSRMSVPARGTAL
jgi:methylated-DNA-[protein]-cysteine S-methyltransferase